MQKKTFNGWTNDTSLLVELQHDFSSTTVVSHSEEMPYKISRRSAMWIIFSVLIFHTDSLNIKVCSDSSMRSPVTQNHKGAAHDQFFHGMMHDQLYITSSSPLQCTKRLEE